jgi:hypothetical protein
LGDGAAECVGHHLRQARRAQQSAPGSDHLGRLIPARGDQSVDFAEAQGGGFYLTDLGSTNGTFTFGSLPGTVNLREQVPARAKRELRSWSRLAFAGIEAVFVCDLDADNRPFPAEQLERALQVVRQGTRIEAAVLERAREQAGRDEVHAVEILIRDGVIPASRWFESLTQVQLNPSGILAAPKRLHRKSWIVAIVAALVLALLYYVLFGQ